MASLYQLTGDYLALRDALESDNPEDEDVAREALARIGAAEDALETKQLGCAFIVRGMNADLVTIDNEIARLTLRKEALTQSRDWLKRRIMESMTLHGVTKVKGPTLTISVTPNPPKVVVLDESAIPERFMVTPEPPPPPKPRPDKAAILAEFKLTKADVPGTRVEREERLTIK